MKLLKKIAKAAIGIICFVAIFAAAGFWYIEEQGNFHTITPGVAYRSAQLDADELEQYIHRYQIRSIINLRGEKNGASWYEEEKAVCRKLYVSHHDLKLSARKAPSLKKIKKLAELFQAVPRPVLIHCEGGADRSGLAAALWKVAIEGAPVAIAKKELSIRYFHMPFGKTQVMDKIFDKWVSMATHGSNISSTS